MRDTSPNYFADQEIITEEMLAELDACNNEDRNEQSGVVEGRELFPGAFLINHESHYH
jgi:hypothetical protein